MLRSIVFQGVYDLDETAGRRLVIGGIREFRRIVPDRRALSAFSSREGRARREPVPTRG